MAPMLSGATRLVFFRKRRPPQGAMPGTLVPPPDPAPSRIHAVVYDHNELTDRELQGADEASPHVPDGSVAWLDVQGLGDEQLLRRLGETFGIHPLALADAVNVPQRPKFEDYEHQQLFITRLARLTPAAALDIEQVSVFLGRNYVLTLQERPGDTFDPVRRRLRAGKGPIRRSGSDYLAYALIDAALDGFYPVVEAVGDRLHELEEQILTRPTDATLHRVHDLRRELLALRRAVWPQREAIAALMADSNEFVSDEVRNYLRDCHDHAVQLTDVIETYREFAGNLMEMYVSMLSMRTNDVMKVLTIMASIFIPLTFVAGIYGMNFGYMPELQVRWAYFVVLGVMVLVAAGMLLYFYRRGWIGSRRSNRTGVPLDSG